MTPDVIRDDGENTSEPLLVTHDLEEAHNYITDVYIPHELKTRDGRVLDFRLRYLDSERLTVGHLVYGADSELLVPPMRDCYHMNLTLHGQTMNSQRGRWASTAAGRSGVLFNPTDAFTVRWSPEAVQFAVKLPRRSVEAHLGKLIHRPVERPISFNLGVDLTSPAGQSLLSTVHFLRRELTRPGGIATMPVARDQLESLVLTQLLLAIPSNFTELLLRTPEPPAKKGHVQRVVDLIEAHPERDLTLAELAHAAGTTARALQRGFKDVVGMSPTAYVRAVRLDRVHAELLSEPGVAVTDVAIKWGFFHLGRFAQQYRERFGVVPSQTVRRKLQQA